MLSTWNVKLDAVSVDVVNRCFLLQGCISFTLVVLSLCVCVCAQVGPYDQTVRKPTKGSVMAYWKAEDGLKASDTMVEALSQGEQVSSTISRERRHPPRRVDVSGGHPEGSGSGLEAGIEADEPSVSPEVSTTFGCVFWC